MSCKSIHQHLEVPGSERQAVESKCCDQTSLRRMSFSLGTPSIVTMNSSFCFAQDYWVYGMLHVLRLSEKDDRGFLDPKPLGFTRSSCRSHRSTIFPIKRRLSGQTTSRNSRRYATSNDCGNSQQQCICTWRHHQTQPDGDIHTL